MPKKGENRESMLRKRAEARPKALALWDEGRTVKQIGHELGYSYKTIERWIEAEVDTFATRPKEETKRITLRLLEKLLHVHAKRGLGGNVASTKLAFEAIEKVWRVLNLFPKSAQPINVNVTTFEGLIVAMRNLPSAELERVASGERPDLPALPEKVPEEEDDLADLDGSEPLAPKEKVPQGKDEERSDDGLRREDEGGKP